MRGGIRDWWPLAAVAAFDISAVWLLYAVWHSAHRIDLATYGAFAVPVVTLMAGPIAWAWRARIRSAGRTTVGHELDRIADLLAMAVKTQWEQAAGERGLVAEPIPVTWGTPSLPLAGPVAVATGSRRFAPLPGLTPTREARLAAGQIDDLHAVYGGLRSGRLVIAGTPGSGKSSAAVVLVLAALEHRDRVRAEDRVKVPVPVLFTAQDWDPRHQPLKEWLTRGLLQTYPLFAGRSGAANADGLIDAGRMAVILDGLDEIAEELRPVALQALNQASFRVVVLSRTAEMASAASQRGVLQGAAAVELRVIDPDTAANYLERVQLDPPPDGWHDLIDQIRANPAGPLAEALDNPLALTLIRDTYQSGDDARELLDYCDAIQQLISGTQAAEQITSHLLDRVLPAAYAPRPGQRSPRYDLQTAQNALTKIAARMNQDGTRDLQWWHIPRWVPSAPRIILSGLVTLLLVGLLIGLEVGLVVGVVAGNMSGLEFGLHYGLLGGVVLGAATGSATGVGARDVSGPPARAGRIREPLLQEISTSKYSKFGIAAGLMAALAAWLLVGNVIGLLVGLFVGLVVGFVTVYAIGLANAWADPDSTSSLSPATSWHNDRKHSMAIGLRVGIVIGLAGTIIGGLLSGLAAGIGWPRLGGGNGYGGGGGLEVGLGGGVGYGLEAGLMVGLALGLAFGLAFGLGAGFGMSRAWPTTLAGTQLANRWHTPLHLMNFLEDARDRNVLRTVGPVYQFRHARLQDHLAVAAANSNGNGRTDQSLEERWKGLNGKRGRIWNSNFMTYSDLCK